MNGVGMQDKTIRNRLSKKIEDWISSIDDPEVQRALKENVIITGGAIASMAMGDPVKDYDVYLRTKSAAKLVSEYYVNKFMELNSNAPHIEVKEVTLSNILGETEERVVNWISSSGVAKDESYTVDDESDEEENDPDHDEESPKGKYVPVYISENAITLSNKIQVVNRFYGEPADIHRNYDFIHACCYYDYRKNKLGMPLEAVRSMQSKTLRYTGSLYPVCSLFRLRKFISRGWKISAGDILKMALQISNIDLTDFRVLREQTTGVDATYFFLFIEAARQRSESGEEITQAYLAEILDRIFYQNDRDRDDVG